MAGGGGLAGPRGGQGRGGEGQIKGARCQEVPGARCQEVSVVKEVPVAGSVSCQEGARCQEVSGAKKVPFAKEVPGARKVLGAREVLGAWDMPHTGEGARETWGHCATGSDRTSLSLSFSFLMLFSDTSFLISYFLFRFYSLLTSVNSHFTLVLSTIR